MFCGMEDPTRRRRRWRECRIAFIRFPTILGALLLPLEPNLIALTNGASKMGPTLETR
jgi:hypothetical protein